MTLDYVIPRIKKEAEEISKTKIAVIDAALLFEMNVDKFCDITIGVLSSENTCVRRVCKRDNISEEIARARIKNQSDTNYFKINCNYCINNEEEKSLVDKINKIFNKDDLSNKNVIQLSNGDIEYLQFRKLLNYSDKLEHCYTMKPLDFNVKNIQEVSKEYEKICRVLNLDANNIYRPKQTHSNNVKKVDIQEAKIYGEELHDVDGLITNKPDKILSLCYADCISLFFYDPIKNVIGNVHSGWRGTYQEIAKTAVYNLKKEYDTNPKDLICRNWTKYKEVLL